MKPILIIHKDNYAKTKERRIEERKVTKLVYVHATKTHLHFCLFRKFI